jgi:hypothetical protein
MIEALCFFSIVHFTKLRVINRQMDVADFRLFEWKQGLTGFLWKTEAPDWQGQGRAGGDYLCGACSIAQMLCLLK